MTQLKDETWAEENTGHQYFYGQIPSSSFKGLFYEIGSVVVNLYDNGVQLLTCSAAAGLVMKQVIIPYTPTGLRQSVLRWKTKVTFKQSAGIITIIWNSDDATWTHQGLRVEMNGGTVKFAFIEAKSLAHATYTIIDTTNVRVNPSAPTALTLTDIPYSSKLTYELMIAASLSSSGTAGMEAVLRVNDKPLKLTNMFKDADIDYFVGGATVGYGLPLSSSQMEVMNSSFGRA